MSEHSRVDRIGGALTRRRDAVASFIAALPGEWMGIPAWSRWMRRGHLLCGKRLGAPHGRGPS